MPNAIAIANAIGMGGGVFNPSKVSGLDVWLESDYGVHSDAGVTPAVATGTVQQWNSKAPAAINLSQATGANRPTYTASSFGTKLGLLFDGTNDNLATTVTAQTAQTIFMVIKSPTNLDGRFLFDYGTDAGVYQDSGTGYGWYSDSAAGRQVINAVGAVACLVTVKLVSAASMVIYSNGTQTNSFDPSDTVIIGTNVKVGADSGLTGFANVNIAALLRYTSALSNGDRLSIERYLGAKYGITVA